MVDRTSTVGDGSDGRPSDRHMLVLIKGDARYVFVFDDCDRAEMLRVLGRFASNPELSFTWYDAAVLANKVRATAGKG